MKSRGEQLRRVGIFICLITFLAPIEARPGMGGSYNSSSSSSSSRSYSSSSSRSFTPSKSSSSNSSSPSNSSYTYTSSTPQPTATFKTKDHRIKMRLQSNGEITVEESFVVLAYEAKVGIKRENLLSHGDWIISDINVSPNVGYANYNNEYIWVQWSEGNNNINLPIRITYIIKNGVTWFGNLPILQIKFSKTQSLSDFRSLEFEWNNQISWASPPSVFHQVYNEEKSYQELIRAEDVSISLEKILFSPKVGSKFQNSLIIKGFPGSSLFSKPNLSADLAPKLTYEIEQTVTIHSEGKNEYNSSIQIKGIENELEIPSIDFGVHRFSASQSSWNQFFTPDFQVVFDLSNFETSFWHLFSATFENLDVSKLSEGAKAKFAFSVFGEQSIDFSQTKTSFVRIPLLSGYPRPAISKFKTRLKFSDPVDTNQTDVYLILSNCTYCDSPEEGDSITIPIHQNWKDGNFDFEWNGILESTISPYLVIKQKQSSLVYNPLNVTYAVLNAFVESPGSGAHTSYLFFFFSTILSLILIGWFETRRQRKISLKRQKSKSLLNAIHTHDPQFEWKDFVKKVEVISEKVVNAWVEGDMAPARHFISAGVFQRFNIQLKLLTEIDRSKNIMKDFAIRNIELIHVTVDQVYMSIHLKLTCSAKDLTIPIDRPDAEIQTKLNKTSEGVYEEVHSFTRKLTCQTNKDIDLIHDFCPSCGAKSPVSHESTKCQYCGSVFNSGESDWVLSEITQMVEWKSHEFEGKSDINSQGFAKQILEDRASALFWKWIYFESLGNSSILKRESTPKFWETLSGKKISPMFLPVIGSCKLTQLELTQEKPEATLEFRWSAARGKDLLPEHRRNRIKILLLKPRQSDLGFGETSCSNCGAPFPELDAMECSYCKASIPNLVSDWLIDANESTS